MNEGRRSFLGSALGAAAGFMAMLLPGKALGWRGRGGGNCYPVAPSPCVPCPCPDEGRLHLALPVTVFYPRPSTSVPGGGEFWVVGDINTAMLGASGTPPYKIDHATIAGSGVNVPPAGDYPPTQANPSNSTIYQFAFQFEKVPLSPPNVTVEVHWLDANNTDYQLDITNLAITN